MHVGIGTFNPIRSENINDHKMHSEYGEINKETADMVTRTLKAGGRVIPCWNYKFTYFGVLRLPKQNS